MSPKRVYCVAVSGDVIAFGGQSGLLKVGEWRDENGDGFVERAQLEAKGDIVSLAFDGTGSFLYSASSDGTILRWEEESKTIVGTERSRLYCIDVCGEWLASATAFRIALRRVGDEDVRVLKTSKSGWFTCVRFSSASSRWLAVGDAAGSLRLFDSTQDLWIQKKTIKFGNSDGRFVTDVLFAHDDATVLVATRNSGVEMLALPSGERVRALHASTLHAESPACLAWHGRRHVLVGFGGGAFVRFATDDLRSVRQCVSNEGTVSALAAACDDAVVVLGASDQTVRFLLARAHVAAVARFYCAALLAFAALKSTRLGALVMQRVAECAADASASELSFAQRTRLFTAARVSLTVRRERHALLADKPLPMRFRHLLARRHYSIDELAKLG